MREKPNPGSDEAIEQGCTCPALDNCHGDGVRSGGKEQSFWINLGCPLHAPCTSYDYANFKKWTTAKNTQRGVSIKCKKGLWSVEAPTKRKAMSEAIGYYAHYFADGEYDE